MASPSGARLPQHVLLHVLGNNQGVVDNSADREREKRDIKDVDPEALLKAQRLDEDGLASRLSEATAFERGAFFHIQRALLAAGWDTEKYMFSSVKSRVEFEGRGPE